MTENILPNDKKQKRILPFWLKKKREDKNLARKEKIHPLRKRIKLRQLKYLPKFLSLKEKRAILVLFVIILVALGWIGFKTYKQHIKIVPGTGGHYIEGVVSEPKYINPILSPSSDSDSDISKLIFSGLMKYNEKQQLVPDLAESYEVTEDQKNYIFHLKQGVKWHDGRNLTADDVVFTVHTIKNPEIESPLKTAFQRVAVEKIDDFTVKFTLTKDPYAPFLTENSTFGILPKHIWEEILPKNFPLAKYNLEPIGSGPYKFKEYKKDKKTGTIKSYTLETFEDYFDKKPYIQEITFKFFNDYPELINAYNKRKITGISYIPPKEKKNIKKEINFYDLKLPQYYAIFFNQTKNTALQEKKVRQALAYAIDREKIISQALQGKAVLANSPIPPNFPGHNPEIKKYEYNPDLAHELLHKAGWRDEDKDGKRAKDNKKLEIRLTFINQPEFLETAKIIKKNWEDVGATVSLEAIDPLELQSEYIRPRNYQALLYGELITYDPDPYPFWHSTQRQDPGLNLTSFKDKSVDRLLEEARKTNNPDERRIKYLHFQNIIAEEVPAIFLYSPTYLYGINKKVKGVKLEYVGIPADRFAGLGNWYININREWK